MTEKLNAFYDMWSYSDVEQKYWVHRCKVNSISGHIAYIAYIIQTVFEFQYFDEEKKESFWLNDIRFYPDDLNIVPAVLNIQIIWSGESWEIDKYEILDDNLDGADRGEMKTILGRIV